MERLSRGIALEDITAVTKISQRHLIALEQESFACFPAASSAKASCAVMWARSAWTRRTGLNAFSKPTTPRDRCSTTTAVGLPSPPTLAKPASCATKPSRFACAGSGAILLLLVVAAAAYLTVRYYGLRVGWWHTLLPFKQAHSDLHVFFNSARSLATRILSWYGR